MRKSLKFLNSTAKNSENSARRLQEKKGSGRLMKMLIGCMKTKEGDMDYSTLN